MSELQRIPDYVDAQAALTMNQYIGKQNFQALLAAFGAHWQTLENELFSLYGQRDLATATGATLDGIGSVVGIDRLGLDDQTYRLLLYGKIAENTGDATLQTLIAVAQKLFQSTEVFAKTPNSLSRTGQNRGAYVVLMVGNPAVPGSLYPLITRLLQQSLPGGVEMAQLGTFGQTAFAFAGTQPWVKGFGSVSDATVGGGLGSLLYNSPY